MDIKKNIKRAVILSLSILTLSCNVSFAHYMSSEQERQFGEAAVREYARQTNTRDMSPRVQELEDIQFKLSANNSVLSRDYKYAGRYLQDVLIWSDMSVNAQSFPGGITLINQGMWNFIFTDNARTDDWKNDQVNHVAATKNAMAFVVAHEFGHFANEDFLRKNDAEQNLSMFYSLLGQNTDPTAQLAGMTQDFVSKMTHRGNSAKYEHQADQKALEFTENSWDYNAGGGLIFFDRLLKLEDKSNDKKDSYEYPHPLTQNRFDRVCDFIKDQSAGRVVIDSTGKVKIENKPFVSVSDHTGVSDREQTFQDAGAIAKAIKFDVNYIVYARRNKLACVEAFVGGDITDIYAVKYDAKAKDYDNITYLTTVNVDKLDLESFLKNDPKLSADKADQAAKAVEKANKLAALIKPDITDKSKTALKWGIPNIDINYFMEQNKIAEKMKK